MPHVQFVEILRHRQAPALHPGAQFREHQAGSVAVLVAHKVVGQETIALLRAEHVKGAVLALEPCACREGEAVVVDCQSFLGQKGALQLVFVDPQLRPDPFETGQGIDDFHPVRFADGVLERGGDERLDQRSPP